MKHIVVFLPGIMGSELWLDDELIWPGPASSLIFKYKKMAELMREDLVAKDIIRSFSISDQYNVLLKDLTECGFSESHEPPTLYLCPYDWRKSNALASKKLADLIDEIYDAHGEDLKISIVAHSMGGLVARFYLESGEYNSRLSFPKITNLITMATPHQGSPFALTAATGMEKRLFLNKEQVRTVISDTRYPSVYQLLPPEGEPFAWNLKQGTEFEPINIYDKKTSSKLELVEDNLKSAIKFRAKLDPKKRPSHVRYFCFVGTREPTVNNLKFLDTGSKYRVTKEELKDAGDGTVPSWSSRLVATQTEPVGGEHGTIYKTDRLRRTLAVLLGKPGVLTAMSIPSCELTISNTVVYPNDPVYVTLNFPSPISTIDGTIELEKSIVDSQGEITTFNKFGSPLDISYNGPEVEKLGIIITAPKYFSVYHIGFRFRGDSELAVKEEFFVQQQ